VNIDNYVLQEGVLFVYYALRLQNELQQTLVFESGAFSAILEVCVLSLFALCAYFSLTVQAAKTNTNPEVLAACVTTLYSIFDGLSHEQVETLITGEVFVEMLLLAAVVFRLRHRKGWGAFRMSALHNMAELLAFTVESRGTDMAVASALVGAGFATDLVPLIASVQIRAERGVLSCLVNLLWTAIDLTDPHEWAEVNMTLTANPLPALLDILALSATNDSTGTESDRVYEPYSSASDRLSAMASKCIHGMTEWIAASTDRLVLFNEEATRQAICEHLLQCVAGSVQHLALTLSVLNVMAHLASERDRTAWLRLGVAVHLCALFETFRVQQVNGVDSESSSVVVLTPEVMVRLVSVLAQCCAVSPSRNHRILARAVAVCESFKTGLEYAMEIVAELKRGKYLLKCKELLLLIDE
jgi:hypothetical protein